MCRGSWLVGILSSAGPVVVRVLARLALRLLLRRSFKQTRQRKTCRRKSSCPMADDSRSLRSLRRRYARNLECRCWHETALLVLWNHRPGNTSSWSQWVLRALLRAAYL